MPGGKDGHQNRRIADLDGAGGEGGIAFAVFRIEMRDKGSERGIGMLEDEGRRALVVIGKVVPGGSPSRLYLKDTKVPCSWLREMLKVTSSFTLTVRFGPGSMIGGSFLTVTFASSVRFPALTVTLAVPGPTGVRLPLPSTRTTFSSWLVHCSRAPLGTTAAFSAVGLSPVKSVRALVLQGDAYHFFEEYDPAARHHQPHNSSKSCRPWSARSDR